VSVENLTVCNFLGGSGGDGQTGNEIWWNGGANSGVVGGWGYVGSYLTATSTYYGGEATAAQYGIFSSNWSGATWDDTYASNFNDSGYYIGACQDVCDQVVDNAWAEYNALGYSGSNSGGQLVVENSQFDNNEDGFDTNSQNGDNPPRRTASVPTVGSARSPTPTPAGSSCTTTSTTTTILMSQPPVQSGDAVIGNAYAGNGFFKNPTNGDIGAVNLEPGPTDCFGGNVEVGGGAPSTSPPALQTLYPACTGDTTVPDLNARLPRRGRL